MSRKRKDALEKIESHIAQLERHLERALAQPGHSSRKKWVSEALGWLVQMERLLPHVGKKTAAEWQARIDGWRAALEGIPDAE
jgi:hypothetical protein